MITLNDEHDDSGRLPPQPPSDLNPFEKFEALTRRLVSVPKSKVDERRRRDGRGENG